MIELMLVLATLFAIGVFRGASTCATICTPAILPYVASSNMSRWQALRMGIMFNLPRTMMLTIFGAIAGGLSSYIFNDEGFIGFLRLSHAGAYMIIGAVLVLMGIHLMRMPGRTDLKRRKRQWGHSGRDHYSDILPWWLQGRGRFVHTWGWLLGFACLAEVGMLEGLAISTLLGVGEPGPLAGAMVGAMAMAVFAIGASIPVIGAIVLASEYTDLKHQGHLQFFSEIMPWLLIMVGAFLIVMTFSGLFS